MLIAATDKFSNFFKHYIKKNKNSLMELSLSRDKMKNSHLKSLYNFSQISVTEHVLTVQILGHSSDCFC